MVGDLDGKGKLKDGTLGFFDSFADEEFLWHQVCILIYIVSASSV